MLPLLFSGLILFNIFPRTWGSWLTMERSTHRARRGFAGCQVWTSCTFCYSGTPEGEVFNSFCPCEATRHCDGLEHRTGRGEGGRNKGEFAPNDGLAVHSPCLYLESRLGTGCRPPSRQPPGGIDGVRSHMCQKACA